MFGYSLAALRLDLQSEACQNCPRGCGNLPLVILGPHESVQGEALVSEDQLKKIQAASNQSSLDSEGNEDCGLHRDSMRLVLP